MTNMKDYDFSPLMKENFRQGRQTNESAEQFLLNASPHSFNAFTHLIMSMEDTWNTLGKKSFLGNDKGLKNFKKFTTKLNDCLTALTLDDIISYNSQPESFRIVILRYLLQMQKAYPNWPSAYEFAYDFFVRNIDSANSLIANLHKDTKIK